MTWEDILKSRRVFTSKYGEEWPLIIRVRGNKYEFIDVSTSPDYGHYQGNNERLSLTLDAAWSAAKLSQKESVLDLRQPSASITNDEIDYKEYNEETDGS